MGFASAAFGSQGNANLQRISIVRGAFEARTPYSEHESSGFGRLEGERFVLPAMKICGCVAVDFERIFRNRIALGSSGIFFEIPPATELQSVLPNGIVGTGYVEKQRISNDQNQS